MRRKLAGLLASVVLLACLTACESPVYPTSGKTAAAVSPTDAAATPAVSAEVSPARQRTTVDNTLRAEMFRDYLSKNYTRLSDLLYGGPAGIGFIDLDCDGGMEMILFDSGASAAMGVMFFDIVDGEVECVSSDITKTGDSARTSPDTVATVNANFLDDFRLIQNPDGEKYFIVKSYNGAADFSFTEYVKFGASGEKLTLTSVAYRYDNYDVNSGKTTGSSFKVAKKDCDESAYNSAVTSLTGSGAEDFGLDAVGVFAWESNSYTSDSAGLLAMADKALSISSGQIDLY